ncbi:hypothetical protein HYV88_00205 [Candidatus Woesearchaeota archaeon]|nr:hypothetical protein [Candidatus Woesearchaeota archaeon]
MGAKEVYRKIKSLEIQGAESIAIYGVKALSLKDISVKELLNLRPTEPMLYNAIKFAEKNGIKKTLDYIKESKKKIIKLAHKKVGKKVFTHCHSSTVVDTLKYAKNHSKKFEVFVSETRPRYQGRKTAEELSRAGIKVTTFVDSAAKSFIKKSDCVFLGMDAIITNNKWKITGIVNKVGSSMFAEIAYDNKIPVYILGNSWKYSPKKLKIEERDLKEIWEKIPKKIKVRNLAFDIIEPKHVKAIITELGILTPKQLMNKAKEEYK